VDLRDYQEELLRKTDELFAQGARSVLAYLPTGGGKTRVGGAAIAEWTAWRDGSRALFVVNRRSLLEQTRSSLAEQGFAPSAIGLIAGDASGPPRRGAVVHVAMVQSLHEGFLASHAELLAEFSVVVVDECHAAAAPSYLALLRALSPSARVLGLTATPFRTSPEESLRAVFPRAVFGPSISSLIERRLLVPPRVYGPTNPRPIPSRPEEASIMLGAAVSHWQRRAGGLRTVAFCDSVAHSKQLAALFRAEGVAAEHVDGETHAKVRARAFAGLRDGTTLVLCNVDVLSEGFDEPALGCVLLLRPTQSPRVYVQQVGRGWCPSLNLP
jgi:superfamily II DNA or RNA helicase